MEKTNFRQWKIAVVGAGTMGTNIAHLFAQHGYEVNIYDLNADCLEKMKAQITNNVNTMIQAGMASADLLPAILTKIHCFHELQPAVKDADYVIEAVFEDVEIKKETFAKLSEYCREDAILTSNTSSLNIYDFVKVKNPAYNEPFLQQYHTYSCHYRSASNLQLESEVLPLHNRYLSLRSYCLYFQDVLVYQ